MSDSKSRTIGVKRSVVTSKSYMLASIRKGYLGLVRPKSGVPVDKHGPNADLRQKGKIAVLACGYGGSVGALMAMGALSLGLEETELKPIVDAWRAANPRIVMLWADIEHAAITAITTRRAVRLQGLRFTYQAGMLFIELPSGRRLAYVKPSLGENRFGGTSITYWGLGPNRKWTQLETYGGKLTENIVQAIARDILTHAIHTLEHDGTRSSCTSTTKSSSTTPL